MEEFKSVNMTQTDWHTCQPHQRHSRNDDQKKPMATLPWETSNAITTNITNCTLPTTRRRKATKVGKLPENESRDNSNRGSLTRSKNSKPEVKLRDRADRA